MTELKTVKHFVVFATVVCATAVGASDHTVNAALVSNSSPLPHAVPRPALPTDDQYTYIDNGVIRVGVDVTRGGAIGYLSASNSKTNVINCHDMGRYIYIFVIVIDIIVVLQTF